MSEKRKLTRRGFLKGAAAAGAAVAGPMVVPSSVLGANAPGNRITIGVIGIGKQGNFHWDILLRRDDVQILAGCDVESKRLKKARARAEEKYGKGSVDTYRDFRECIARDDIDAILMAPPDHWHAIIAIEAMIAGKDVYCEKPLTLTINEGRAIANAAKRYERIFQTGSQQRSGYGGRFRFACEMVRSGRIGEVKTVHVNVGGPSEVCFLPPETPPKTLDWDTWQGPAPKRPYNSILCPDHTRSFPNWRKYRAYSGGGMTDWGAHHFDIAQWGLGMDDSGPVEIIPPGEGVELLTYRYANGVTMTHGGGPWGNGVEFVGTEGRVRVNRGTLETVPGDLMSKPIGPDEVHLYESRSHHENWLECVRSRREPICPAEIGHRTATVCHLGNIAYWTGERFRWDPEKEEVVDNSDAARWITRPHREPWVLPGQGKFSI